MRRLTTPLDVVNIFLLLLPLTSLPLISKEVCVTYVTKMNAFFILQANGEAFAKILMFKNRSLE